MGAALNVHEGPMSVSPRWKNVEVLKEGMVISNEPGYYEDGNFGIRIENLVEIEHVNNGSETSAVSKKKFFKLRKLTLIPIQQNLIKKEIMTKAEFDWLDDYHSLVLERIGPLLEDGTPAKEWLLKSCTKIDRERI